MNDDARDAIHMLVWSGFYPADEILEIVTTELFERDEIDADAVEAAIREEFDRKRVAEAGWPEITDCDRLDAAFEELNAAGIIALHNAGYEQSDGITEVTEIYLDQGGEESTVRGYCFYHGQDLEGAVDGAGLMLTFGDIRGDDARGVLIGQEIVATLQRHALTSTWPGTIGQRIELPHIAWQRRWRDETELRSISVY